MKVFILALDGLEHSFVEKWKLRNLLQTVHGTYSVEEFGQIKNLSTSVWASFITGRYHRFESWWKRGKLYKLVRLLPDRYVWKVSRLLNPKLIDRSDLLCDSLFEKVENAVAVNVPVYNEKTEYHIEKLDALHFGGIEEYVNTVWNVHWKREKDVMEKITCDWDLFMVWFDLADLIGHLYINRELEMRRLYDALEVYTAFLKKSVPNGSVFLIVSDHGIEGRDGFFGEHTKTAFWSVNVRTDWKPRRVVDFFPKILEWVES